MNEIEERIIAEINRYYYDHYHYPTHVLVPQSYRGKVGICQWNIPLSPPMRLFMTDAEHDVSSAFLSSISVSIEYSETCAGIQAKTRIPPLESEYAS